MNLQLVACMDDQYKLSIVNMIKLPQLFLLLIILSLLSDHVKGANIEVKAVTTPVRHGEGPYWSEKEQALFYVDVFQPAVLRWDARRNQVTSNKIDGDSIGPVIPIKNRNNSYIVCADRNVNLLTWDGKMNNSGSLQKLTSVDENKPHNQFNDGKADVSGNLWAGTLTRNKDLTVKNYGGTLYQIKGSNLNSTIPMLAPLSISNGMAWNRKNTKYFYIDSETRKVMRYKFDITKGTIEFPQLLFDLDEYPEYKGIPDGMTIDNNDNLWVAIFGGKAVLNIDSESGTLLNVIKMPVTYPSSVAFGGPNLSTLYITTSRLHLTQEQVDSAEPLAGAVFAVRNLNVQGVPANEFILQ